MAVRKQQSYIIGIDEVGRGPLAGPVVVCAVMIPRTLRPTTLAPTLPLRDSKKMTATQRRQWTTTVKQHPRICHAVASVSPSVIDRINITQAANRAATRALVKLIARLPSPAKIDVFLDGGIHIVQNSNFKFLISKNATKQKYLSRFHSLKTNTCIDLTIETVIKGDETIPAISLASIVAKQYRDTLMYRAHKKYPLYGFDCHVGYGTKRHIAAIKKIGQSPLHRKSFLRKI